MLRLFHHVHVYVSFRILFSVLMLVSRVDQVFAFQASDRDERGGRSVDLDCCCSNDRRTTEALFLNFPDDAPAL